MRITETKTITKTVTKDVLCNKCGESCKLPTSSLQFYGLIETKVSGGYDSIILDDLHTYTFSLCEACLKELFETFKLPVEEGRY